MPTNAASQLSYSKAHEDIDASFVNRVLDEGGRILGKAVCENVCYTVGEVFLPQVVP